MNLLLLLGMGILMQFGTDNFTPSLPAITHYFHVDSTITQYTVMLYILGASLCQFIFGPLADVYGRKPMLLIGLSVFCLGSVFCLFSTSIEWLLIGRFIQGAGLASMSLFRAIMRDRYRGEELAKAASILTIVYSMTPPLAPITGGYLQAWFGWRASFVLLALMGLAGLFFYGRYFKETLLLEKRQTLSIRQTLQNAWACIANRKFLPFAMTSSMCVGGIFGFLTMGAFIFQHQLGWSAIAYGWISVTSVLSMPVGAYCSNRFIQRLGSYQLLVIGGLLMTGAALLMLMMGCLGFFNMWVILAPMLLLYAGAGIIFPNSFSLAFKHVGHIAGMAGAVFGGLQSLGGAIAMSIAANLPLTTQIPLSIFLLCCGLVALLMTAIAR